MTFLNPTHPLGTRWREFLLAWGTSPGPSAGRAYHYAVEDVPDTFANAIPITTTAAQLYTLVSRLESSTDRDVIRFNATAGQMLFVSFLTDFPVGFSPIVAIPYGPNLQPLTSGPLPVTGTYYLEVRSLLPQLPLSESLYSIHWMHADASLMVPRISVASPTVQFGSVAVGGSRTMFLEISNAGLLPLVITNLALPANSSVEAPFPPLPVPFALAPGESIALPVTLNGITNQVLNETMMVQSSDPVQQQIAVSLLGEVYAAPRLLEPKFLSNHVFTARIAFEAGRAYQLERSTNLLTWIVITNVAPTAVSPLNFQDPQRAFRGFYRVTAP